jgi:hypothetical protein
MILQDTYRFYSRVFETVEEIGSSAQGGDGDAVEVYAALACVAP